MTIVTVHEAKTNLSKLIAEVLAGGEVVIAKGKVPSVRLVPIKQPGKRRFGALKGKIAIGMMAVGGGVAVTGIVLTIINSKAKRILPNVEVMGVLERAV